MSFLMRSIYPYRVWVARELEVSNGRSTRTQAAVAADITITPAMTTPMTATTPAAARRARSRLRHDGRSRDHAKHRFDHHGDTYYFCSAGCRTKFVADPAAYLGGSKPTAEAPEGAIYTCPMHPEIRQVGPGSCPICGMALEPEVASRRYAAQSRTRRHDAALLDRPRADAAGLRAGNGRPSRRRSRLGRPDAVELDPVRARHAGRAVGGLAVLRARLAIAASRAISTCSR